MFALDSLTVLDRNARIFFLVTFLIFLLVKVILYILPVLKFNMLTFSQIVSEKIPRLTKYITPAIDFINSKDIPANISMDFIHEHLKQTAELMKKETNNRVFMKPPSSLKKYLVGCLIFSVFIAFIWTKNPQKTKRILFPFKKEILENYLEIKPKNIQRIRGQSLDIEAFWKTFPQGIPILKIKESSGSWSKKEWSHIDRNTFKYSIEKLTDKITYKLFYKDLESSLYEIVPRDWPGFKNIKWRVTYPGYTGKNLEELDFVPAESNVLKGSIVQIKGTCKEELSKSELIIQTEQETDKIKFKKTSSDRYEINFKPEKDSQYWFSLESKDGLENPAPEVYKLNIFYDKCPEIEILSPVFELEVAPMDELKIIYAVKDDFGINSVFLERKVKINNEYVEGLKTRETIQTFNKPLPLKFSDSLFVHFLNLPDKSMVQFNLTATDNSTPESHHHDRPQVCKSQEVKVRIKDYEKNHADSYAKISESKLLTEKLLHKETDILYKLHTSTETPFSDKDLKDFEDLWRSYVNHNEETFQHLIEDAHFNPGLTQEFGLIKETSKSLSLNEVPEAIKSMRKKEFNDSAAIHEKLKNFLDKANQSLEKILNYQYIKDLQFKTQSLDASSNNLLNQMKEMKETSLQDAYKWKQLEQMIKKINQELAELQKIFSKTQMPTLKQQERVFGVPVNAALKHSEMLANAIAERNMDKALALAKEMLEDIGKTRQALEDFLQYKMNASENFSEKLKQLENSWQELVQNQSSALEENTRFENSMFIKIDRKKLDFLQDLTKKQKELVEKSKTVPEISSQTLSEIKTIYEELAGKNLAKAKEKIDLLMSNLSSDAIGARWIKLQQQEISDNLKKLENETFFMDETDLKMFLQSANYQNEITTKAIALDSEIKKLEETIMFPPEIPKRLNTAIQEMQTAYDFLNNKDLKNAIPHQIKALEELDFGKNMLNQMVQFHKNFPKNVSQNIVPGPKIHTRGHYGSDTSGVRLPDEKDYVPAIEMRKKIMESLQEKYPKSQKILIDDYLRKISE